MSTRSDAITTQDGVVTGAGASAFQDNSVRNALSGVDAQAQVGGISLDSFSPFSSQANTTITAQQTRNPTSYRNDSNTMPPLGAPPAYTVSAAQPISTDDLEKRARDLAEKEAQLAAREQALEKASQRGGQLNNWPPLPSWFPVGPCFYQDIEIEIPSSFQSIVRRGYILWVGHTAVLLFNFIGAICYFAVANSNPLTASSAGTTLGCAILFIVMFTPCSYVCWFRPLYKAMRSDSSLHFLAFFSVFFIQCIVSVVNAIGFVGYGAVGWINSLATIGTSLGAGIVMLICASLFTALAVLDFVLLVSVHRLYRSSGASLAQAKNELATSVFTNPAAQTAFVQAAAAGVSAPPGSHRF